MLIRMSPIAIVSEHNVTDDTVTESDKYESP